MSLNDCDMELLNDCNLQNWWRMVRAHFAPPDFQLHRILFGKLEINTEIASLLGHTFSLSVFFSRKMKKFSWKRLCRGNLARIRKRLNLVFLDWFQLLPHEPLQYLPLSLRSELYLLGAMSLIHKDFNVCKTVHSLQKAFKRVVETMSVVCELVPDDLGWELEALRLASIKPYVESLQDSYYGLLTSSPMD